jgi:uncharacterized protein YjiS (DUF1127 family)
MAILRQRGTISPRLASMSGSFSFKTIFATISLWSDRIRQRRDLAELDDFMLRDLGLSRRDVRWESSKPFWWP